MTQITLSPKYYMKSLLEGFNTKQGSKYTGRFIMFSVITNIYNKKTKGLTLMELFTDTGKLKRVSFYN
jgi:hypothetical protein